MREFLVVLEDLQRLTVRAKDLAAAVALGASELKEGERMVGVLEAKWIDTAVRAKLQERTEMWERNE